MVFLAMHTTAKEQKHFLGIYLLLFFLVNLHLLRNITPFYFVILVVVYLLAFVSSLPGMAFSRVDGLMFYYFLFVCTAVCISLHTIYLFGMDAGLYASTRYFLTMPLAILAFSEIKKSDDVSKIFKVYVYVIAVGSLVIPLQYIVGPISWLAESSERGELIRYSSLFGSLTVMGLAGTFAFYLMLSINFTIWERIVLGSMLIVGLLLSLQKSAIIGVLLSVTLFLLFSSRKDIIKKITITVAVLMVTIAAVNYMPLTGDIPLSQALDYAYSSFGVDDDGLSARGADDTIMESSIRRLTELPASSLHDLYLLYGEAGYLWGGSFAMMGNALMRENDTDYIMPHNNFVDLLVVGGIFHLILFLVIIYFVMIRLWVFIKKKDSAENDLGVHQAMFGFMVLFIINMPFTSSLSFHPSTSALFWTIIGVVARQHMIEAKQPSNKRM